MGFSSPFISWIKACICTTKFSIKLNGIVYGYFDGAQGIRQGDHLSPYLFTICINVLCCLLKPKPPSFKYHWKCKHLNITHMFFADDVLFFSHANVDSVKHIMNNIVIFSSMSGLQPSIHKSNSFFCNASPEYFDWFDNDFSIPRGCLPVKFLGMSSIYGQLCLNDYIPLINKITARIHNWTSLLLSFAGRVCLINSVVHAIEAYRCNHFLLPTAALPTPNSRHHHVDPLLTQWLEHFSFPVVHVHREDRILWAGIHAVKIKTWNIWDSIRNRGAEIHWDLAVWHKLTIYRYAHHQWVACHGRLPNFARLARFGIAFSQICYLCIGGLETDNHLLRHCPYSVFADETEQRTKKWEVDALKLKVIKLRREELKLEERVLRASLEETKGAKSTRKEKRVHVKEDDSTDSNSQHGRKMSKVVLTLDFDQEEEGDVFDTRLSMLEKAMFGDKKFNRKPVVT
ncbi:uncharacterized protein LOC141680739 [Apium graveolens]|uniref:uncharacterized protein LOC141680739 n=1 Tax=Apium graveolens TaxID=4045 RepID=UPI003D7AE667